MSGILAAMLGSGGEKELMLNISNIYAPNIATMLSAAGWNGRAPVRLSLSGTNGALALAIPEIDFPLGLYLYIASGCRVSGLRGGGGSGGYQGGGAYGRSGGTGGTAIYTRRPIKIENWGEIVAGGGGGGGGAGAYVYRTTGPDAGLYMWGEGGAGGVGSGGVPSAGPGSAISYYTGGGQAGAAGTVGTARSTGFGGDISAKAYGGTGGTGGSEAGAGSAGASSTVSGGYTQSATDSGGTGGPAGFYIDGDAYVTWVRKGTVKGRVA